MSKNHLFAAIVWSAALAATGAAADVRNSADASKQAVSEQSDAEEAAIRRVLSEFRTTRVPLSQAMAIAERLHSGSKTADISFEIAGPPVYRIRTLRNERVWENAIDAKTGDVTGTETTFSLKELDREDLAKFVALKWIKQELSDAVQVAEKAAGGNALAGGLMRQDGRLNFVVVVASGDHLKEVMLEPPKISGQASGDR
ncbi:PepSY domain-containing protein [Bradyrhizobium sp. BR 10261]|uniref:PepSY domain-containing protein n=1 Tax=Bradyrhizobium sp. BR 10261 TaxID=2749992 RepID=UPI001C650EB2|nr:PepSY domain-containing protein [Bradyrhizobium sp. BR 10261]MBW7961410.1 PepSY domain-containing protein [Bradyrhizobium sp. BR 10261]